MTGASIGFFNFTIYLCYAYAFMIGAVWIDKPYWNHAEDRDYMGGDVIGVFFGVLIGLFSLGGAGPAINAINIAKANGKMVYALIDRKVPIDQDDINSVVHEIKGEIEFRNVEFYYPTRTDSLVMKEFSHKFEVGKTTAIVGPSGSGKSTCIQLVERFYDPTAGEILIDGKPLKGINLRNYRQQIGYVGQEPVMFNMSIKDNILMGKPTASDKEIEEALKAVNAWDFVSKYTNGINEHVGAGGGQLSGGQK
jgi:ATP-binding cassette subfamily B (MDR/TAP) protein 1